MSTSGHVDVVATRATNGEAANTIRFAWSQISQSIPNNNTVIGWNIQLIAHRYGAISSSASKGWNVSVNGNNYSGTTTIGIGANTYRVLASGNTTIPHNGDGTKAFGFSFSQYFGISFNGSVGTVSGNGSANLETIPRWANYTKHVVSSRTQTSAVIQWAANATCNRVRYQIGNGNWVQVSTASASSGSYTINGLVPNTSYSIKTEIKRSDSGLVTNSSSVSVTTLPIATTTSSVNFNIGANLTVSIANSGNNASTLYLEVQNDSGGWERVSTVTSAKGSSSYSWNLSGIASTLYSKCVKRNQMNVRVVCGVTLNGTWYSRKVTGVAKVVNSNPTFSNYSYNNTDVSSNDILGDNLFMIQGRGNMRAIITTNYKAVPKNNATISKYVTTVTNASNQVLVSKEAGFSSSATVNIDLGAFVNGSHKINIYAVDSRGNKTGTVSKPFTVIPYHVPNSRISIARANGYEKETRLVFSSTYSTLMLGNVPKNNVFSAKYRYMEVGGSAWSAYTDLTNLTTTQQNVDTVASITLDPFKDLDVNSSYNFQFVITDKIGSRTESLSVVQGIPIMAEFDTGHISVGMIPDFNNNAKLQVGSDIIATDSNGTKRQVMGTLEKLVKSVGDVEYTKASDFLKDLEAWATKYNTYTVAVPFKAKFASSISPNGKNTWFKGHYYIQNLCTNGFTYDDAGTVIATIHGNSYVGHIRSSVGAGSSVETATIVWNRDMGILNRIYPVGSIYMSVNSTNPASLMGGSWAIWGSGRVPVGVDTNQKEFNSVQKTGGQKYTENLYLQGKDFGGLQGGTGSADYKGRVLVSPPELENNYSYAVPFNQSVMQPYITCYMWRRTA